MQQTLNGNKQKGALIVEILIVITVIVVALSSLLGVVTFSLRISTLIKETVQANNLARETMEVVRNFRDGTVWDTNGLGTLSVGVPYYPQKSSDSQPRWQLIQGEEEIYGFIRKVVFNNVARDANDNIVETGGTNDPHTKKATVTVSWKGKKVEIFTYFTNWQ